MAGLAGNDGVIGARPSHGGDDGRQRVLNVDWPLRDSGGRRHAEGIPDRRQPIAVEVRIELERDGEVWLPGLASRWTRTHVFVGGLSDPRLTGSFVWVLAGDVRRR